MANPIPFMLALLVQDPNTARPSNTAAPSYSDDVRCAGILYGAQLRLRQRDERQPGIQAALQAAIARIDARTTAGEVDTATVEADLQRAVNDGAAATEDVLAACTTEPASPNVDTSGA